MRPHPQVIAHRGSNELFAEHTLAAYQRAIDDGADGLECDVRLTADGVLVCVHDRTINRTSDGTGPISIKTYGELSERDFGSWKTTPNRPVDEELSMSLRAARDLLTLETLFELIVSAPRPLDLVIETKHPTRYAGLVEERVAAMIRRFGLDRPKPTDPRARVMSFSEIALRRMRTIAPAVHTVLLMSRIPLRSRNGWLPAGARIAGPGIDLIRHDPGFVQRLHSTGSEVHVWTVDETEDIELCVQLGVDAIITNRPDAVLARLGR